MTSQAAGLSPQLLPPESSFLLNEGKRKYPHVINSGLDRLSGIEPSAHVAFINPGFRDDAGSPVTHRTLWNLCKITAIKVAGW